MFTPRFNRPKTFAVLAASGLACACPSSAIAGDQRNLTAEEKSKVRDAIWLLWDAWEDCMDETLEDTFNKPGDPGEADNRIEYEDIEGQNGEPDRDATFEDAILKLFDMLDTDDLQTECIRGFGYTKPAAGIDNDTVILGEDWLDLYCNGTDVEKACAKLELAATLANEIVHVFEVPTEDDAQGCDVERDSECATLKFFNPVLAAMVDADGEVHESTDDIENDPDAVFGLAQCLEDLGIDTAEEIAELYEKIDFSRDLSQDLKTNLFENELSNGRSWAELYYDGKYKSPLLLRKELRNNGNDVRLTDPRGNAQDYSLPDGKVVIGFNVYVNDDGCLVLVMHGFNPTTLESCVVFHVDEDKSGLPDAAVAGSVDLPNALGQLESHDVRLIASVPEAWNGTGNGLIMHDKRFGNVSLVDLDSDGVGTGLVQPIVENQPLLGLDQMIHLHEWIQPFPDVPVVQFIFSSTPYGIQSPESPAMGVIVNFDTMFSEVFPPAPLASIKVPGTLPVGVSRRPRDGEPVQLMGTPGDLVNLILIGRGLFDPVFQLPIEQDGYSLPQIPPTTGLAGQLILVQGFGINGPDEKIQFLPPQGANVDCKLMDPNGDGAMDRLHLTANPPRLHMFEGLSPDPLDPVKNYQYEQVLPMPRVGGFAPMPIPDPFGPFGIMGPGFDMPMVPVPLPGQPPMFVPGPFDLNGDGSEGESIMIRKPMFIDPFFDIALVEGLGTPLPIMHDPVPLPDLFVPDHFELVPINDDQFMDIVVHDFNGGSPLCVINLGNGNFEVTFCPPPCPADLNNDGILDFFDVARFLQWFSDGDPRADWNNDTILDFFDVLLYLDAFSTGCP